jgi:hypothetical protein
MPRLLFAQIDNPVKRQGRDIQTCKVAHSKRNVDFNLAQYFNDSHT